jgi:predicted transcriptional regulator
LSAVLSLQLCPDQFICGATAPFSGLMDCNEMTEVSRDELIALTADIVSAYVANNSVEADKLSGLISSVHGALSGAGAPQTLEPVKREPAIPVKKSVTPDFLYSLLDGKKYKSLKRHLSTNGMTPDEYRAEFGLPKDYPMVAANYSAARSSLAKTLGLGRKAAVPEAANEPAAEAAPAKRGRKKAA